MGTIVMMRVMLALQNASYAMQGSPPLLKPWSSGSTVTGVANGPTHTVLWALTQPLLGLCVHHVVHHAPSLGPLSVYDHLWRLVLIVMLHSLHFSGFWILVIIRARAVLSPRGGCASTASTASGLSVRTAL